MCRAVSILWSNNMICRAVSILWSDNTKYSVKGKDNFYLTSVVPSVQWKATVRSLPPPTVSAPIILTLP